MDEPEELTEEDRVNFRNLMDEAYAAEDPGAHGTLSFSAGLEPVFEAWVATRHTNVVFSHREVRDGGSVIEYDWLAQ